MDGVTQVEDVRGAGRTEALVSACRGTPTNDWSPFRRTERSSPCAMVRQEIPMQAPSYSLDTTWRTLLKDLGVAPADALSDVLPQNVNSDAGISHPGQAGGRRLCRRRCSSPSWATTAGRPRHHGRSISCTTSSGRSPVSWVIASTVLKIFSRSCSRVSI